MRPMTQYLFPEITHKIMWLFCHRVSLVFSSVDQAPTFGCISYISLHSLVCDMGENGDMLE